VSGFRDWLRSFDLGLLSLNPPGGITAQVDNCGLVSELLLPAANPVKFMFNWLM